MMPIARSWKPCNNLLRKRMLDLLWDPNPWSIIAFQDIHYWYCYGWASQGYWLCVLKDNACTTVQELFTLKCFWVQSYVHVWYLQKRLKATLVHTCLLSRQKYFNKENFSVYSNIFCYIGSSLQINISPPSLFSVTKTVLFNWGERLLDNFGKLSLNNAGIKIKLVMKSVLSEQNLLYIEQNLLKYTAEISLSLFIVHYWPHEHWPTPKQYHNKMEIEQVFPTVTLTRYVLEFACTQYSLKWWQYTLSQRSASVAF